MKIILLSLSTHLQYDRNDFESAHLSGWAKNFARGLLSNTKKYEVECWSLYDTKVFGKRGVSVLEGGDSKWYCKGLLFKFFPSVNFFNEPISFELINNVKKEINSGNKVIFHSQSIHTLMYMLVSILCRNVPFVVSSRGPGGPPILMFKHARARFHYIIKHFIEFFTNKYVDFIFCGSKGEYQFSKSQIGNDKVMLERGGGIDFSQINKKSKEEIRKELNLPIKSKIILHVGRFNEYAGLPSIIKLYKKLKKKIDIELVIIGGTKEQPLYNHLISSNAIVKEYIPHNELLRFIKASDVYIMLIDNPQHHIFGGLGTAIIEATSHGVPVVSTSLIHFQGTPEERNKLGYLPKIPIDINDVEKGVIELLNNPNSFSEIRDVSKKYFSWDIVMRHHLNKYNELLNKYY